MRNLYAKKCCWCKVVVQPGQGKVWNYNDSWFVGCPNCMDDKFKDDDQGDQLPYFFCLSTLGMVQTMPKKFCQIYFFICILYTMCYTSGVRSLI